MDDELVCDECGEVVDDPETLLLCGCGSVCCPACVTFAADAEALCFGCADRVAEEAVDAADEVAS